MGFFEDDVAEALREYMQSGYGDRIGDGGDGLLLLEVFRRAAKYRIPAPEEAYLALSFVLERYESGECRTLDEAMYVSRPKNWKQPSTAAKNKKNLGVRRITRLWHRAKQLQGEGTPTDEKLWEKLADEFAISPSRARDWYYEYAQNIRLTP